MAWQDENAAWLARAERWRPRKVEPLRVRVWLSTPVVWDDRDPITLDGPLGYAVVLAETGRLPDDVFAGCGNGRAADIPIPIADAMIAGRPIACASWGIPPPCAVQAVRWRRKRARADHYNAPRVSIGGGPYKALNIPVGTLVTPWLDFYVRGDREQIGTLLRGLGGLGRDSTRGLGTVLGVEVTDDPDDRSLLYRGVPQRCLPIVLDGGETDPRSLASDGWEERETTTRAPYWVMDAPALCACPSLRIVRGEPDGWGAPAAVTSLPAPPSSPAPKTGAAGRFFVTPHAVRAYIDRIEPHLSFEAAQEKLIGLTSAGRCMGPYAGEHIGQIEGAELWRTPRVRRGGRELADSNVRFVVAPATEGALQAVVTVLPHRHG